MLQLVLLQLGTDHAQTAGKAGRTTADILLPWHIVEMDPGPIGAGHDALRPQDNATLFGVVQTRQSRVDLLFRVLTGRLSSPADEDIVGIMVMAAGATTVVMMVRALALCSRNSATVSISFFSLMPSVRLRTIAAACSIWLLKNSPKFFM